MCGTNVSLKFIITAKTFVFLNNYDQNDHMNDELAKMKKTQTVTWQMAVSVTNIIFLSWGIKKKKKKKDLFQIWYLFLPMDIIRSCGGHHFRKYGMFFSDICFITVHKSQLKTMSIYCKQWSTPYECCNLFRTRFAWRWPRAAQAGI